MATVIRDFDPKLDLIQTWDVAVPRSVLWKGWTEPALLKKWFCPKPWNVTECEIDLTPGGVFRTVMQGPNGEGHTTDGCYLEIVPERKLVWTMLLLPGYRPAPKPFLPVTSIVTFDDHGAGTRYTAHILHPDEETKVKHAEMGFPQGWSIALDQLVSMAGEIQR